MARAGCQSLTRPPWRANPAQSCAAFHASTGANNARPITAAAQGCHRRSQGRTAGTTSSHKPTPIHRNNAVYLLSSANPPATPATSHHRPEPPAAIRAIAQNVAVQKNSSGESGVMITVPTPSNSEAFNNSTAVTPALVPGNRVRAVSNNIHDASAAASGPSRRTPSAVWPASAVPAQIHNATIGG